jgi:hypothetical protein
LPLVVLHRSRRTPRPCAIDLVMRAERGCDLSLNRGNEIA